MSGRSIPYEIDDPSDHVNSKLIEKQQDHLVEPPQDSAETKKQSVLTVSQLTRKIRLSLENKFRGLTVEGELSNFHRAPSGHWYFTLKDEESQIRGVMFRPSTSSVRFRPEDGLEVTLRGHLTVYSPRGEYQLNVSSICLLYTSPSPRDS